MKMVKPRTNGGQSKMELQRNNLDRLINGLVLPQFPTMQLCHAPWIPNLWFTCKKLGYALLIGITSYK